MSHSLNCPSARRWASWTAAIVVFACLSAGAQTAPNATSALTPAQQKAQARAAQQAAAKQAAEERRLAAQQAAQNRKAGTTSATTQRPAATATNTATSLPAPAAAGTAYRPGNNKSTATTPTNTTGTGSAAVGSGTLAWGPRVYTSTGCAHNGNSAVCTFTFVNQGNEATLSAGGAGELSGIQLVDDAHVPHRWDGAHFLDKYGTQQPRLIVQAGDTGTYVVTFPNVNPQVTTAEFHLRNQIIGGVTFSGAQTTTAAGAAPAGAK